MAVPCQLVLQCLRELCPPRYALGKDPTGLQVGTADKQVERVLCTLDLTLDVAQEAARLGAGLVISHHAVIFRPLNDLRTDGSNSRGRILEELLKNNVAVYVPHTALDVTPGGINDRVADLLGLKERTFLESTGRDEQVLHIAAPRDNDPGRLEATARQAGATEARQVGDALHVIAPLSRSARVREKLTQVTGEEPLTLPLRSHQAPRGIGRVGYLDPTPSVQDLARQLKETLEAPVVRVAAPDLTVAARKVAVLCGDGRSFVEKAIFSGADAMVTGDVDHHTALEARARGLALIDVGHWASERFVADIVALDLRRRLDGKPVQIDVSGVSTQPFAVL